MTTDPLVQKKKTLDEANREIIEAESAAKQAV
jgi:hypothetical protein